MTFLRKTTLIVLAFLSFYCSQAQENSLLWKISGNGINQPSFIYGTIHLICSGVELDRKVKEAIDQAESVVLELDMDDPQLAVEMQKYSLNADMKNFQDVLTEQQAQTINTFLTEQYGADLSQLGLLKPFVVMSMILMKNTPCESVTAIEQLILNEAQQNQQNVQGLETVALQMSFFDEVPLPDQVDWLMEAVKDDYSAELKKMLDVYQREDLTQLQKIIAESPGFAEYEDLLLNERNKNWIPRMEELIRAKSTFFAVGAGHLPGEEGVISLLKSKGYEVTPVF